MPERASSTSDSVNTEKQTPKERPADPLLSGDTVSSSLGDTQRISLKEVRKTVVPHVPDVPQQSSLPERENAEPDFEAEELEQAKIADAQTMLHWHALKAGDDPDNLHRNWLMEKYFPLVRYNGERIWARLPEGVELDDLVSAGVFGLMDAIEAFDLGRGVKFETYCVPRIRGEMLDELRKMDWVPRLVRSKASTLQKKTAELDAQLGREPEVDELAKYMGMSVKDLERMIIEAQVTTLSSLDKIRYETADFYKDVSEKDLLTDKKGEDPTRPLQNMDVLRIVTKGLNRNERLIVILYYFQEQTMKQIGKTLDLSESRVSQMHSAVIAWLKEQFPDKNLDAFLERRLGKGKDVGRKNVERDAA